MMSNLPRVEEAESLSTKELAFCIGRSAKFVLNRMADGDPLFQPLPLGRPYLWSPEIVQTIKRKSPQLVGDAVAK